MGAGRALIHYASFLGRESVETFSHMLRLWSKP
jgi:hypothetical protein